MDVLEIARLLGKAVQDDERCQKYLEAKKAVNEDTELQNMINDFNLKKMSYEYDLKKGREKSELEPLEKELSELYQKIINTDKMKAHTKAHTEMSMMLNEVMSIVTQCAEGADPDTCNPNISCTGDCSSCGGCTNK